MSGHVVLCGLGGQGIVRAALRLGQIAMAAGHTVRIHTSYGVSQSEGSVSCHVRFGPAPAAGPLEWGTADWVLAAERFEAERLHGLLRPEGELVVSDHTQPPNSLFFVPGATTEPTLPAICTDVPVTALLAVNRLPLSCSGLVLLGWVLNRLAGDEAWPANSAPSDDDLSPEALAIYVGSAAHATAIEATNTQRRNP